MRQDTIPSTMNDQEKIKVLFVCTGNSCRSQMAEGFVSEWAGDRIEAKSAGSHPADEISRRTELVMREVGIDISKQYPKSLDTMQDEEFDYVITLCDFARDFCPVFHSKKGEAKRLHWSIPDPHGATADLEASMKVYRDTRDMIAEHLVKWLNEEFGIKVVYEPGRE
jgi:arsenate reductase